MVTNYKTAFIADPAAFCAEHAIALPGAGNDGGKVGGLTNGDYYDFVLPTGGTRKRGYNVAPTPQDVAFRPHERGHMELIIRGSQRGDNFNGPTPERDTVPIPNDHFFKAYFLPWQNGCVARMDIPVGPTRHFFTAEMNGCAFMATGNRASPTVAHYNLEEPVPAPQNWPQARHLELERQIRETLQGRNTNGAKLLTKWGPHAVTGTTEDGYITNGPTYDKGPLDDAAAIGSLDATLWQENKKIKDRTKFVCDIKVATMGVCGANGWDFYYQRQVEVYSTAVLDRLRSKWKGLGKHIFGDSRIATSRTMRFVIPNNGYNTLWP